jgi:hypothetical protein
MSEIMGLRTMILGRSFLSTRISIPRSHWLDNVKTVYPKVSPNYLYILTCEEDIGGDHWTVIFGLPRPGNGNDPVYDEIYYIGRGDTPEAAYRDILKATALEVFHLNY